VNRNDKDRKHYPLAKFIPEISIGIYRDSKSRDFMARNIGYNQAVNFNQNLRAVSIDY